MALLNAAAKLITGHSFTLSNHRIAAAAVLLGWEFIYFAYQWAVSGKTLGMAVLGIQVVSRQGAPITPRQAFLRTIGLGLTLLTLGIGFLGIVYSRERRGLDDAIAGTAVVYSWDARARVCAGWPVKNPRRARERSRCHLAEESMAASTMPPCPSPKSPAPTHKWRSSR